MTWRMCLRVGIRRNNGATVTHWSKVVTNSFHRFGFTHDSWKNGAINNSPRKPFLCAKQKRKRKLINKGKVDPGEWILKMILSEQIIQNFNKAQNELNSPLPWHCVWQVWTPHSPQGPAASRAPSWTDGRRRAETCRRLQRGPEDRDDTVPLPTLNTALFPQRERDRPWGGVQMSLAINR